MSDTGQITHHEIQSVAPGRFDEHPEGAWIQFSTITTGLGGLREWIRARSVSREEPDDDGQLVASLREANEVELRACMERRGAYAPSGVWRSFDE